MAERPQALSIASATDGAERIFYMAEQVVLQAEKRTVTGKAVKSLRRAGTLPANLTGRKQEAEAIQVNAHEFEKLLKSHGRTTIIKLAIAPSSRSSQASQSALTFASAVHVRHAVLRL